MYIRTAPSRASVENGQLRAMDTAPLIANPKFPGGRNLLLQELRETLERARLGGFFYPMATGLGFLVTSRNHIVPALAITGFFSLIAFARLSLRVSANPADPRSGSQLLRIWSLILTTRFCWGHSAGGPFQARTTDRGAALGHLRHGPAHSMCMRRIPCAMAIASVMAPSGVLLWHFVAPGVVLYRSKVSGRNRTERAQAGMAPIPAGIAPAG